MKSNALNLVLFLSKHFSFLAKMSIASIAGSKWGKT